MHSGVGFELCKTNAANLDTIGFIRCCVNGIAAGIDMASLDQKAGHVDAGSDAGFAILLVL